MSTDCSQSEFYQGHLFIENERRMRLVVILNCLIMFAEIVGGQWFGSMALLADGFHMATHVGALGISVFAYAYARRHAHDPNYSFGTAKVGELAAFASAMLLILIALYILFESGSRLLSPVPIAYIDATLIAVLGLAVNGASAFILRGKDHHHGHSHEHAHAHNDHGHDHSHHHDSNFRSAYLHVLADAITSLLAIGALLCGWLFNWSWLDPVVGIIGAIVILSWARSLIATTSSVLLDRTPASPHADDVRTMLGKQDLQITDIHIWRVGPNANALILNVIAKQGFTAATIRDLLKPLRFAHITVELNEKS